MYGASVIILEGIMAFVDKELLQVRSLVLSLFEEFLSEVIRSCCLHSSPFFLQLLDMKIFVDTDSDIRLVRRLRRDITERGRDIEGVIKQYNKFVKPAFEQYIEPSMRLADIVVPRGRNIFKNMFHLLRGDTNRTLNCLFIFYLRWWEHGGH